MRLRRGGICILSAAVHDATGAVVYFLTRHEPVGVHQQQQLRLPAPVAPEFVAMMSEG